MRNLYRKLPASSEAERRAHERREAVTKNLLSNLRRTKEHPTLNTVTEIADIFSLTLDGAHKLFGYQLDNIRDYDRDLNHHRTHIIDSYSFERTMLVDLPDELGSAEMFRKDAHLSELVNKWQGDVPLRALGSPDWKSSNSLYIHVGTQDSVGSGLLPGSLAMVAPLTATEATRPNPRMIYLLQFGNGYRCSRCVVSGGKLLLLNAPGTYRGPERFTYLRHD